MRSILKKLDRREKLNEQQYQKLISYIEKLRSESFESYALFQQRYAQIIFDDYCTYLPPFIYGWDELINLLLAEPALIPLLRAEPFPIQMFPAHYHPYLRYISQDSQGFLLWKKLLSSLPQFTDKNAPLPKARQNSPVYVFEDGNPYKEIGLKTHFDRLGRYEFVTRLQSYRYLARGKAKQDRIEYIAPDRLGGIFSNKEKSIYYYIYLSQYDSDRAHNACRLLNLVFYDIIS